jgi:hypothetical protein
MKQKTVIRAAIAALVMVPAGAAIAAQPMLYEESIARHEEKLIIASPIGGVENSKWFDYRSNVGEAQKELASDLRRSTDLEDTRDAWSEYAHELKDGRHDYIKAMARKGYRIPEIYFEN